MVCCNQRRDCLNYTQKNDLCCVDQYLSSRQPLVVKLYLMHLQQWRPICSGIVTESSLVLHIQSLVIDVVQRFAALAMGRHWSSLSLQHIVPEWGAEQAALDSASSRTPVPWQRTEYKSRTDSMFFTSGPSARPNCCLNLHLCVLSEFRAFCSALSEVFFLSDHGVVIATIKVLTD